jgi:hypothetical protein
MQQFLRFITRRLYTARHISGMESFKESQGIQINHQQDATSSPVYYLKFMYSSTCFGCPHAHHQKLNNYSSSLWFYRWSVVVAVLLVVVGPAGVRHVYTPHNSHSSVSTHPRHQLAATLVNTTRYWKYSQVFLMMGENIA